MVSFDNALILGLTFAYLILVLGIGAYAARKSLNTTEDFYVASRTFGTLVLFFALFATNMTAVTMIGAPGLTYQAGAGTLGFFTGLFAMLFPIFLMTLGYRFWIAGKRFGHVTPGELFNHRWESSYLGVVATVILIFWSIPVIQTGIQGAGIAFEALTEGLIQFWLGALIIVTVVALYVLIGGMRGTGWTNTFQGAVFLFFLIAIFIWIPLRIGGFSQASAAVAQIQDGAFINRSGPPQFTPRMWLSFGIVGMMGTAMLPWLFIRVLTSRSVENLKKTAVIYPLAVLLAWIPAVMIGFWGLAHMPDVANPDFILPLMVEDVLPVWVLGLALVGILAAIMSSIDGIVLTLSTMFSVDFARKYFDFTEQREVLLTRVFIVLVLAAAYASAILTDETIIGTGIIFLQGFSGVFFPLAASLYWKGSTEESVLIGLLIGFFGFWSFELGLLPMVLTFGFVPMVPVLLVQLILMVAVAWVTDTPSSARLEAYEEAFPDRW